MSLNKFKSKATEVEKILTPRIKSKRDKRYNSDYKSRVYNDKVLNELHIKQIKYDKAINDKLKATLDELKDSAPDEMKSLGIDSINDMFVYAVKEIFLK